MLRSITERIAQQPQIQFAEPDAIMQPTQLIPNDPNYPQQWHYFAPAANNFGVNLPRAWDITTGINNVVVAVLDFLQE